MKSKTFASISERVSKLPWRAAGIAALAAILSLAPLSTPASAQKARLGSGINIGIVNVVEVTRGVAMAKDIARQINEIRKKFTNEIKREEEKLRNAGEELNRKRAILPPESFAAERKKYDVRLRDMQRKVQGRQSQLASIRKAGDREFARQLSIAVLALAQQRGLTLILRKREVIVTADDFEITKFVIAEIDKNMPSYTIPKELLETGK